MSRTLVICCTDEAQGEIFSLVRADHGSNNFDHIIVGGNGEWLIRVTSYYTRYRPTANLHSQKRIDFATACVKTPIHDTNTFKRDLEKDGWSFLNQRETEDAYPDFMKALSSE